MQTIKAYLDDTYNFLSHGKVIHTGIDDKGYFFILNKTIFYPQGGGQPSDQGHVELDGTHFVVNHVKIIDNQIRHYSDRDCQELINKTPQLIIDKDKRLLHSKLHTSGHLIKDMVERHYPQYRAIKGHHFPGECYVEFSIHHQSPQELDLETLNNNIHHIISENLTLENINISRDELPNYCPNLSYSIAQTENIRLIRMLPFNYQPCGGTHVKSSMELKGLSLTKQKLKGNHLKINYHINI